MREEWTHSSVASQHSMLSSARPPQACAGAEAGKVDSSEGLLTVHVRVPTGKRVRSSSPLLPVPVTSGTAALGPHPHYRRQPLKTHTPKGHHFATHVLSGIRELVNNCLSSPKFYINHPCNFFLKKRYYFDTAAIPYQIKETISSYGIEKWRAKIKNWEGLTNCYEIIVNF